MRRLLTLFLILAVAGGAVACGSSGSNGSNSGGTHHYAFAKTRFLLHAGLAFGAFHHFIYKPYKQGEFRAGAPHRARNIAKAALAGAFTYHEVKQARKFVQSSAVLRRLFSPLTALTASAASLPALLKRGGGGQQLDQINNQIGSISQQSSQAGAPITERTPPAAALGG